MSDLVRRDTTPLVYTEPTAIEKWAGDLETAYAAAKRLVQTSFVPEAFRGKPAEAAAAIMTGAEVGLTPLAALRSIVVIQGTPAFTAVALRGLAQSHGHVMWLVESTATRAIIRGRRLGEDEVQESVWTMDRAKALGLVNKSNWKNQPIAMLVARATSELARLIAADVLLGLPYSAEEISDGLAEVGIDTPPKAPLTRRVQRKPLPVPAPEPEPENATLEPETPMVFVSEPEDEQAAYERRTTAEHDAWLAEQEPDA